jgi:transposase
MINGILWRLRTGAPWHSINRRLRRWSACGVWESVAIALAERMTESGIMRSTALRFAPMSSAAGRKGGFVNELLAAHGVVHQ